MRLSLKRSYLQNTSGLEVKFFILISGPTIDTPFKACTIKCTFFFPPKSFTRSKSVSKNTCCCFLVRWCALLGDAAGIWKCWSPIFLLLVWLVTSKKDTVKQFQYRRIPTHNMRNMESLQAAGGVVFLEKWRFQLTQVPSTSPPKKIHILIHIHESYSVSTPSYARIFPCIYRSTLHWM